MGGGGGGERSDAVPELNLPPGFRFHPTDEELVVHYLSRKAAHRPLPVPIAADVDLYKFHPWELPEKALFGRKEWYFFTPRERKYPNGSRPNRTAGNGYWKATGADKPVSPPAPLGDPNPRPRAIKKSLVYYQGKAPKGVKTDWIMHEYRLAALDTPAPTDKKSDLRLDEWVLCRLYNKKNAWGEEKMQQQHRELKESSSSSSSSSSSMKATTESAGIINHHVSPSDLDRMGQPRKAKETAAAANWFSDMDLDALQQDSLPQPSDLHGRYLDMGYFQNVAAWPHLSPAQSNTMLTPPSS